MAMRPLEREMGRHLLRRAAAAALAAALVVLPLSAQNTEINSARIRVEPRTRGAISVTAENLRDRALQAWRIELTPGGSSEWNYIGDLERFANAGAIAPPAFAGRPDGSV
jgi:hypothetical protein